MKLALAVVAAIAVGGAAWWFLAGAGSGSGEPATSPEACASPPDLYGTPPAGYSYAQLDAQGQRELREDLNVEALGASDVRPAIRADSRERVAALVAVSMEGKSGGMVDFAAGMAASGIESTRRDVAGRDVRWLDYGDRGAGAAGFKACHIVMVLGADEQSIEPVAEAVFGPG